MVGSLEEVGVRRRSIMSFTGVIGSVAKVPRTDVSFAGAQASRETAVRLNGKTPVTRNADLIVDSVNALVAAVW